MSEETLLTNIDLDLTGVSARPILLAVQTKRCTVGQCGVKKTEQGLRRCIIPLTLEEPAVSIDHNPVAVGFRMTNSFLLDASGGWTKERAAEEFLRVKMAIEGVDERTAKDSPHDLTKWSGRQVDVTFSTDKKGENQNFKLSAVRS